MPLGGWTLSTRHTAAPSRRRRATAEGAGPRYQSIAEAIQGTRASTPQATEIARLYGVSLTTAQFVRRALHTRRRSPVLQSAGGLRGTENTKWPPWRRVADDLGDRIRAGLPQDRLPNRAQLATEYGVSATTINKAVNLLTEQGLLSPRPVRGSAMALPRTGRTPTP
ncbi:GntR family transcriptional regulator [Streptomyces sp. NPDC094438]